MFLFFTLFINWIGEVDHLELPPKSKQVINQLVNSLSPFDEISFFQIERLYEGHSHQNFYLHLNGEKYFFKLAHPSKSECLHWEFEVLKHLEGSDVLTPTSVKLIEQEQTVLVLKKLEGSKWNFSEQELYTRLIPEIKKIHSLHLPIEKEFDHIQIVLEALERTKGVRHLDLINPSDILRVKEKLQPYLHKREKVFCHNDLHSGNLIHTPDEKIVVIDWETSSLNDYLFDLAILASHHQLSLDQMKEMLIAYDHYSSDEFEMFILARTVIDLYYHLWCIEKIPICDRKESLTTYAKIYLDSYLRHLEISQTKQLI